jgi:hypothetical protein
VAARSAVWVRTKASSPRVLPRNQDKEIARSKATYQKNRQKCIERAIRNRANNSERYKEQAKEHFEEKHKFQHHVCLIRNRSLFVGTKARHERSKKRQDNLRLRRRG